MNPPHTGQSLSLETCLRRYADKLPIRVQVTSGYFPPDDDEGGVLNSGEIFDLKGLVLGEVVVCLDGYNQCKVLPVRDNVQFEVMGHYPRFDDVIFESVAEWSSAIPRPKQVRVLESVDTGDDLSTIYIDDVLTFQRKDKNGAKVLNQQREVICLPNDFKCKFSSQVDPKAYHMEELVAKRQHDFPLRVRPTSSKRGGKGRTNVFLLKEVRKEVSVIAQVHNEASDLIAIPIDLDITVIPV